MSAGTPVRHLLRDDDLSPVEQAQVLALAAAYKREPYAYRPLAGPRTVAMIFDKQTLRTQSSFAAGIAELGGHPLLVDGALAGIGVRESVADVARVLDRQASAVVWRTYEQSRLEEMAAWSRVPVVNALTDDFHPCQLLADLQTLAEARGPLPGMRVAFLGDGACNVAASWLLGGATAGMHVRVAAPDGFLPGEAVLGRAAEIAGTTGGSVAATTDPAEALADADVVVTDTWVSMGREEQAEQRTAVFGAYALDAAALAQAGPDAHVLHCLPAYRGKEIAAEVIDGPRSLVWDEAENRRHAQKAVLAFLLARSGQLPAEETAAVEDVVAAAGVPDPVGA
ncbi:ornithine carbamoyltransferase [Nocardioides sp. CPCC 205120]|uniref:ornithine carbamoyltransferase n=1 Tax=Nocardioides sp. CPCC 205120 TaxID=3406462 RepID=UPI003B510834